LPEPCFELLVQWICPLKERPIPQNIHFRSPFMQGEPAGTNRPVTYAEATHRFTANLASALAGPYLFVERCPSFVMIEFCFSEVPLVGDTALVDDE
jgi:hypothetical protein